MNKEEEGLTGHEMLEVDARQWWEEARAVILASPGTDEQKQAGIEALGPAPAAGTMIRLDAEGDTVMTSGLEATPSASRATETEPELVNETGQREIAQGVLGDDAEHGIDLVPITRTEWTDLGDGTRTRIAVGKSEQGYHYAVEVSRDGEEPGAPTWSSPFDYRDEAEISGEEVVIDMALEVHERSLYPPEPPIDSPRDVPGEPGYGTGGECYRNEAGQLDRDPEEGPARIVTRREGDSGYHMSRTTSYYVRRGELVAVLKETFVDSCEGSVEETEWLNAAGQRHKEDGPAYSYASVHNIPEETYLDRKKIEFWRNGERIETRDRTYEDIIAYKPAHVRGAFGYDVDDGPDGDPDEDRGLGR
jgi:hypothetical protein